MAAGAEALWEADAVLSGGGLPVGPMLGAVCPDHVGAVVARGAEGIQDVLLLAELADRGIPLTGVEPFGTVVIDAGPMICFIYRGRPCAVEGTEKGRWQVCANFAVQPGNYDSVTATVERSGRDARQVITEVFTALDCLVAEAMGREAGLPAAHSV